MGGVCYEGGTTYKCSVNRGVPLSENLPPSENLGGGLSIPARRTERTNDFSLTTRSSDTRERQDVVTEQWVQKHPQGRPEKGGPERVGMLSL